MTQQLNLDRELSKVDPSAFVADTAVVLDDVTIGRESSVWFQAVVRGDVGPIAIGERTNIQDGAIVHADVGYPVSIGDGVTVGHGAVIHGATVEDDVLIGIKAVVLNGAVIGEGSIVGAGAVVTEGTVIPPRSLVLGVPGRVAREVSPQQEELIRWSAEEYVRLARAYREGGGAS
ncbi:MAG: gamma carbonic anhydrase family protein [Anaerolineae bacterium]